MKKSVKLTIAVITILVVIAGVVTFFALKPADEIGQPVDASRIYTDPTEMPLPWENGGKNTDKYTWEEYQRLPDSQKDAFYESFSSAKEFDEWMNNAKAAELPWNSGGKEAEDYTWDEYLALSDSDKELFFESFESSEAFDEWMIKARNDALPWNNGGKHPAEYTWEEYEKLDGYQQEAFYESFENDADFEAWLNANQPE
ncbi:MAG: hypothetical protein IJE48_08875 [Clostridia bacterium]|nr:hypothetical protein [Clostridia bacterium]